jgi:hypothetical protein
MHKWWQSQQPNNCNLLRVWEFRQIPIFNDMELDSETRLHVSSTYNPELVRQVKTLCQLLLLL